MFIYTLTLESSSARSASTRATCSTSRPTRSSGASACDRACLVFCRRPRQRIPVGRKGIIAPAGNARFARAASREPDVDRERA